MAQKMHFLEMYRAELKSASPERGPTLARQWAVIRRGGPELDPNPIGSQWVRKSYRVAEEMHGGPGSLSRPGTAAFMTGGPKRVAHGAARVAKGFLRGGVAGGAWAAARFGGRIAGRAIPYVGWGLLALDLGIPIYKKIAEKLQDPFEDDDRRDIAALRGAAAATGSRDPYLRQMRVLAAQRNALNVAKATGVDQKDANMAMAHAIARASFVEGNWDQIRQMALAAAKSDKPEEAAAEELAKIRGWKSRKVDKGVLEYKRPAKGGN